MESRRPPLAFIFTVTLTGILNNTLLTPALPDILADLDVPDARSGLLVAAAPMSGIVVAPLVGFLADRFGRRSVLTTCLTLFGGFGALAALAPSFGVLLAARFLQGTGSAGLVNLAVVLIGDHWKGPARTRLVGRNAAVLTVGLAVLPLVSGIVTEVANWRVTFGLYTISLGTAAAAWLILDPYRPASPPSIRDQVSGAGTVIRRPEVSVTLLIAALVFVLIFGLFLSVFPLLLADRFGMGAGMRGVIIATPAVTSSLVAFNLGRIRSVLSPRAVVIAGGIGFAMAFAGLGLSAVIWLTVVAASAYGASEGILVPTVQDFAMEAAPDEHRGAVVAVWVGAARVGQTVGPLLASLALTVWSPGTTLLTGAAVGTIMFLVGMLGPLARSERAVAS